MADYVKNIRRSGLTIYDSIEVGDPDLWIPGPQLETLLDAALVGHDLAGLPLRTRSKVVKTRVCEALGYPVPQSFRKTQPRFPGQQFDTYVQKSNNLQIWNEELAPTRRYALMRVGSDGVIQRVKVVSGDTLALLDTTGTLTQKYQARFTMQGPALELVTRDDTHNIRPVYRLSERASEIWTSPTSEPTHGNLLPIEEIYRRLVPVVGSSFPDTGVDQERNRGAALHRLVCEALGYTSYRDDGSFPDVRNQLLEVKLQTSPTIDLGLVSPDSIEPLDVAQIHGRQVRHCDVRYAVFFGVLNKSVVTLTHLVVTTGEAFFTRFQRFGGRILNTKLQIPLPARFFDL